MWAQAPVRDLFQQPRRAPCHHLYRRDRRRGRQRGSGLGGGHDEREQTLNQLLVEMDGSNEGGGAGRHQLRIFWTRRCCVRDGSTGPCGAKPDIKGREEILQSTHKNKPLAEDVDLKQNRPGTAGFTGADHRTSSTGSPPLL